MDLRAEHLRRVAAQSAHRRTYLDAVSFLTVFLVLLVGIQSQLVIAPLGAVGSPATMLAGVGFGWWVLHHAQRPESTSTGTQPVRVALLVLFFSFLASYAAAFLRPISVAERSTAQIGIISIVGALGVALLVNDGIPTFERFYTFVDRLVVAGGLLAALGVVQFLANRTLVDQISIPGLVSNGSFGVLTRGGFTRPAGTAVHPIEFGSVITMILPLAVSRGLRLTSRPVLARWWPAAVIALGIVVSISRSALVCGVVGMVILASTWQRRAQQILFGCSVGLLAVVAVTIPGMLGTLTNLFTGASDDGSVESRTGSYAIAWEFFQRSPMSGRGYSTFLPAYRIFDNEYLLLLIEVGLLGVLSLLALVFVAGRSARKARTLSTDPTVQASGQSVLASVCAGASGLALFDGLSFPMCTSVFFIVVGLSGALLRLVKESAVTTPNLQERSP